MHGDLQAAFNPAGISKMNAFFDLGCFIFNTEQPVLPIRQGQEQASRYLEALDLGGWFEMKPQTGLMLRN